MAFTPNSSLYQPSNVTFRDQQHAARVFTDDQFRLAPKSKFLFHVAFNINPAALKNIDLVQRHRNEINLMVKDCDLPSFGLTVETLNQYNRKKNVQTTHKYNPISMTFHDDNMGLINQLWQNYYSYYYADSTSAKDPGAYKRNATKSSSYISNTFGLDNGSTAPFFNYITIYQMARHEFVSYTLLNPIISLWNHNKVGYAQSGTHDNIMQLQYEAVSYSSGDVVPGDPEGFGFEHYDQTPSSLIGDTSSSSASPSFAAPANPSTQQIADVVTQQLNTYQNTKQADNAGSTTLSSVAAVTQQTSTNGLVGFQFPNATAAVNTTVATQSTLGK